MDLSIASPLDRWALAPDVVHLNHGSFGGCPRAVLDASIAWRTRLEAAPMRFLVLEWQQELDRARAALAAFLNAPVEQTVFVPNATTGVAIALANARIEAGDELVIPDHGYRACKNQLARAAAARGARVVIAPIALPYDPAQAAASIAETVTDRTRLVLLDHITSPTGVILPLEEIVPPLAARGIQVIVDGAHAPGQLALDVGALLALGVTWYAGNNHKWLCAPKASGFLVTTTPLVPLVTSHGASAEYGPANRLHAELDWAGTYDPSVQLAVPTAIETVAQLGGGWPTVIARNHALALELRARFVRAMSGDARHELAPAASIGSMAAVPITLPPSTTCLALQKHLLADGWEIPIVDFFAGPLVRLSAHLYNTADQADLLAARLRRAGVALREL